MTTTPSDRRIHIQGRPPRVLLAGVFGPYGVDDRFGRKENIMELFHNQVTKAQGPASLRFHHRSFGLYFIAQNIRAESTVLDFPSRRRFIRELRHNYDVVGISFITPNFSKAREMARLVRRESPNSIIVLGGHGAAIEGIEKHIDCDHVVKGEGICWFRAFLGEDPTAPIYHPVMPASEREAIFGVPVTKPTASILVPGVGCVNGCYFCSTSHFFGKTYSPFLSTGKDIFRQACKIADERGTDMFFVMDENFLKDRDRAMELMAEQDKAKRWFTYYTFSSAEAIRAFGIENVARLGVNLLWIGLESSNTEAFPKNAGLNAKQLVHDLRDHGIPVLASGILCMEHHTPDNIMQDIDFLIGLKADFVQFMLLTGLPTTALYLDHKERDILRFELPFEEWHGQNELNYNHPAFPADEARKWLDLAFKKDFETNHSSILRMTQTGFYGYKKIAAMKNRDACMETRMKQMANRVRFNGLLLPIIARYAPSAEERRIALELDREQIDAIGPLSFKEKCMRAYAMTAATLWMARSAVFGDMVQPATIVTRYKPATGNPSDHGYSVEA